MSAAAETPASRGALILAFATIYLVWGSTYLAIRVSVESMPPFAMAAARFLLAGALLIAFLKMRGAPWPTARQWLSSVICGTFLLLGGNGVVAYAEQTVSSANAALFIGIGPLFTVLIEWAWPGGLRPNVLTFLALALGLAGVTWLSAPWENVTVRSGISLVDALLLLVACLSWSFGAIYGRHAKNAASPFMTSAQQMLGGGLALALAALLRGEWATLELSAITARSWNAFAYLVVVGSLVGFSTFVWLMKHSTPVLVSTYSYVNPIVAVFLGWLILHEPVTDRTAVAAALIVGAVALLTVAKNRRAV